MTVLDDLPKNYALKLLPEKIKLAIDIDSPNNRALYKMMGTNGTVAHISL